MDAAGDTIAAWERQSTAGPGDNVQIVDTLRGQRLHRAGRLSAAATDPEVAMTPAGEAVVAWWHFANPPGVSVLELGDPPARRRLIRRRSTSDIAASK